MSVPFKLAPLPWDEDALAPTISASTISFHYHKHHQTYVDTLNKLVAGTPYADIAKSGRRPTISNTFPATAAGSRSVEARVEDGRWLQVCERRTTEGLADRASAQPGSRRAKDNSIPSANIVVIRE